MSILNILSLGAGVQSTTVLLMSIKGELQPLDHAIFADTGWEPAEVYSHLEWLKGICADAGLPLHVVQAKNLRDDLTKKKKSGRIDIDIPVYSYTKTGEKGMVGRRVCTFDYKIRPVKKFIKMELLGLGLHGRFPKEIAVDMWMGISTDELQRAKLSEDRWLDKSYPLIAHRMTRQDCHRWLESNYPDIKTPRSACIGCPFHSDDEWRRLKETDPAGWADAVEVDKSIRNNEGFDSQIFLHRQCVPLEDVDLSTAEDYGQVDMFSNDCIGMCGT